MREAEEGSEPVLGGASSEGAEVLCPSHSEGTRLTSSPAGQRKEE